MKFLFVFLKNVFKNAKKAFLDEIHLVHKAFRPLKGLFILLHRHFWKSYSGPFFTFIFPVLFIGILGWVLGFYVVLGGALSMGGIAIALNAMPQAIFEFKNSSLLKRIGTTPIKPWLFLIVVVSYYIGIVIVSFFWTLLISLVIFVPYWDKRPYESFLVHFPSMKELLSHVMWLQFFYSYALTVFVALAAGMMIVSVAKTSAHVQTLGMVVFVLSLLLSAQLFPIYIIRKVEWLWWLGYVLTPFKSAVGLVLESWNGPFDLSDNINQQWPSWSNMEFSTIFEINKPYTMWPVVRLANMEAEKIVVFDRDDKIANLCLPYGWAILFSVITIKKFSWGVR